MPDELIFHDGYTAGMTDVRNGLEDRSARPLPADSLAEQVERAFRLWWQAYATGYSAWKIS